MRKKHLSDLKIGDITTFEKTITDADIFAFTGISGDFNPLHVSEAYAKNTRFKGRLAHGMLSACLIDYTLTDMIGSGGIHISQFVKFKAPVMVGDTILVTSRIKEIIPVRSRVKIESTLTNQKGDIVITGLAEVKLAD